MAAFTASVTGNWSNTATWGGSGPPGAGDTVTINSGITVTVDAAACTASVLAVGSDPGGAVGSGTPAIAWATGPSAQAKLVINANLTLRLKGDLSTFGKHVPADNTTAAAITLNQGASLIFDPPSAGTYVWKWKDGLLVTTLGATNTGIWPDTSAGNHCIIKTDLARGGNAAYYVADGTSFGGSPWGMLTSIAFTDFVNFGNSTNWGFASWQANSGVAITTAISISHCTFTACSYNISPQTSVDPAITFTFNIFASSTVFASFLGDANVCAAIRPGVQVSATRTFDNCSFDAAVAMTASGNTPFTNCFFNNGIIVNGTWTVPSDAAFNNNFLVVTTNGGTAPGDMRDCFFYGNGSNTHFINVAVTATLTGLVFEPGPLVTAGDSILPPNATFHLYKCFSIAGGSGTGIQDIVQSLSASGLAMTAEHCLGVATTGLFFTGETSNSFTGEFVALRSNICYNAVSNTARIGFDQSVTKGTDALTLADYNAVHNPKTSTIKANGVAGTAAIGYEGFTVTAAGAGGVGGTNTQVGLHDFNADPQFFDPALRNLEQWSTSVGGAGTIADGLARLAANPALISAMIIWVRAGYAPTNVTFRGASYPGDPSTTDANGNPWAGGATPDVGPMAFVSPFSPWIFGDQCNEGMG